ncbi:hypothetical protein bthur0001_22540 [Bacillus thuringiensis serovar tochigiensis BGSC 4Y1]|nr:hypothetical protein bthur0001_22540 [Bacillus thuringiensis serovar tochigiensis BGSC 4Y1]
MHIGTQQNNPFINRSNRGETYRMNQLSFFEAIDEKGDTYSCGERAENI